MAQVELFAALDVQELPAEVSWFVVVIDAQSWGKHRGEDGFAWTPCIMCCGINLLGIMCTDGTEFQDSVTVSVQRMFRRYVGALL